MVNKVLSIMQLVIAPFELFMGIPVLGWMTNISLLFIPSILLGFAHIAMMVILIVNKMKWYPSLLGLLAAILSIVPFIGMFLHLGSAGTYIYEGVVGLTKK